MFVWIAILPSILCGFLRGKQKLTPLQHYILILVMILLAAYMQDGSTAFMILIILLSGGEFGNSIVAIGLTGGIATGKSTVSKILEEAGAVIVDADVIARSVVEPGKPAYYRIISAFGDGILNEDDKTLDRAKLGALIFNDDKKRKELNACTHKFIIYEMFKRLVLLKLIYRHQFVVFDAPLLYETHFLEMFCYPIIVVSCSKCIAIDRLKKRNLLAENEAEQRIRAQMSLEQKKEKAHFVIENSGSIELLTENVNRVAEGIRKLP
uniref:Uncharacterized protein AlNc14C223G9157 n=1 Tax=Albugo laibachii Nc14 TaxID=890382 RepID=F0WS15_9STRA|nr:conserved hypothetical protein [Albugo laibachii Nc14]|eukprot:CCA24133.1 conserved hypothetical protein [Albugo laibachii Nc14]